MAQFYTLDEAARILGMSADDLKSKAQTHEVRAFLDGGTWRFKAGDVDELARRRGLGSDAELRLADIDDRGGDSDELMELDLSDFQIEVGHHGLGTGSASRSKSKPSDDSGSHDEIFLDDLALPPGPITASSSVIIGAPTSGKHPGDSDVRLVPPTTKSASDSDVQLAPSLSNRPSDSDVTLIKADTSDHSMLSSGAGDTAVGLSPFADPSAGGPASGSDSDFELNASGEMIDALEPDSGSDFELSALDASDEFESTPHKASDSDVTAADPKLSGINLSRPSDSGINLHGGLGLSQSDSIELAPLSDEDLPASKAPAPAKPSKPKPTLAATPPPVAAPKQEKDIFDDTDFEVDLPSIDADSDDNTVQLEAASDFDLDDSDTGSEVFAIDEEGVDQNASTAMAPSSFADDDEDEDDGFESAVSSEMSAGWSTSDSSASPERAAPAMVLSRDSDPEWSGLWVGLLAVNTLFLFFAAFVAFDLVRNLYDFQAGGTMGSGLVRSIASLFGGT